MKRQINQTDLFKAGFVRQPDDYQKDHPADDNYNLWFETWEKQTHHSEVSISYTCCRKSEYGKWHYDSELLELVVRAEFVPLKLDINAAKAVENLLFKRKEGF